MKTLTGLSPGASEDVMFTSGPEEWENQPYAMRAVFQYVRTRRQEKAGHVDSPVARESWPE